MSTPTVSEVEPARFAAVTNRVTRIDAQARAHDGHPALGDAIWLDLESPRRDSAGFLVDDLAYAHVARSDNVAPAHWVLGLAVAPSVRDTSIRTDLVDAAVAHVTAHGGGLLVLWLLGATAADDTELARAELRPARDLYEMRVPLPLGLAAGWAPGLHVRTFEVGHDDAAWLDVNNRAFAGHAEQGGWNEATLARRTAEAWFDPTLFLLALDDQGLVGFDWLKIHEATEDDPRLGEIYVVGVDPRAQGRGLGRSLAVAGLDAVHERGIDTGMLFCAADNAPALALYRKLGFEVHRTDRAYERDVAPE